ncbi:MAG: hypothetical protein JSV39_00375 [Candidatus Aenigmatarchaeota archaeon]|nr:MAG: hypothetical protein JSV39_00375 [Candidatus Aenigmarchaeota archaeon]
MVKLRNPSNYSVCGHLEEVDNRRYIYLDRVTKSVYIEGDKNGSIVNLEKLTPGKYLSLLKDRKEIEMIPGSLFADKVNDSMRFAPKTSINPPEEMLGKIWENLDQNRYRNISILSH